MGRGRKQGDYWFVEEKAAVAAGLGYSSIEEAMTQEYERGQSLQGVADLFGMTKMGVRHSLARQGVEMRSRGGSNRKPGSPWRKNRIFKMED